MLSSLYTEIRQIPVKSVVRVADRNLRKSTGLRDSDIADLAERIKATGQIHPISVRPLPGERYELVAGCRRLLACTLLGWKDILAGVMRPDATVAEVEELHQSETLDRMGLGTYEIAMAARAAIERPYGFPITIAEYAHRAGMSSITLDRLISYTKMMPKEIVKDWSSGEYGHLLTPMALSQLYRMPHDDAAEAWEIWKTQGRVGKPNKPKRPSMGRFRQAHDRAAKSDLPDDVKEIVLAVLEWAQGIRQEAPTFKTTTKGKKKP